MKYFLIILFSIFYIFGYSQNHEILKALKKLESKGEVVIKFTVKNPLDINIFTDFLSIDEQTKQGDNVIYAYANKNQFQKFIKFNIPFEVLTSPGDCPISPKMITDISYKSFSWDAYPAYQVYLDMMSQFQTDFPDLCFVFHIGNSVQGRQIIFARLSGNSNSGLAKPRVMLTSTMHGDEPVGYVTLLRMIDYLLTNYSNTSKITNLLDNYEIWINPLANPDGTFAGGNNTVNGATRFNANSVDLNRNFPDSLYTEVINGTHLNPDGNIRQPENIAMMHLADSLHFVISVNIHSGNEVVNYPWDTKSQRHADESWWQYIAKNYADTVFAHSVPGYFKFYSESGYTNGSDWYIIHGGRQDFMNYFNNCKEFTLEISRDKIPAGSDLPMYWESNYRSLINYIIQASSGFNGFVTDSVTGAPLHSAITIPGHDTDNSNVISELPFGNYYRPVFPGNYQVSCSSSGYISKNFPLNISGNLPVSVNVQLVVDNSAIEKTEQFNDFYIYPNPASDIINLKFNSEKQSVTKINLINLHGENININEKYVSTGIIEFNFSAFPKGIYFLKLINQQQVTTKKIVLN